MFHLTFLFEHWSYRVKTILNIFRSTLKNFLAEASTHATRENVWTIYGIMGFIKLLAGKFELGMVQYNNCHRRWYPIDVPFLGEYMIVITNRKRVGQIRGQDIYRITSFEIVPFVKDLSSLTPAQVRHMER